MSQQVRDAQADDVPALADLEKRCFDSDRISARQFRYLLTKAHASVLVVEMDGVIAGDVVVLFSRATSVARLYSIAVDDTWRGHGLGRELIEAAEKTAWEHQRAYLRLEVRKDNAAAIHLYESLDYRRFGELADYYDDHMDAWRFEKSLAPGLHPELAPVPYYEQTLDFTCGPASLIMAMKALEPSLEISQQLELRLWKEATTIFMTSGHGGCGPYGLALSAARRGFGVEVYVTDEGTHLIDSVRQETKKQVMRLVQDDMEEELRGLGVPIHYSGLDAAGMEALCSDGAILLVLISSWQIYGERFPHWVVVTGFDRHFVYVNDPFVDHEQGETTLDCIHMPILRDQFERMARYGRVKLQAVVAVTNR